MQENKDLLAAAFESFNAENWLEAEQLYRGAIKEAKGIDEQYLNSALHMLAFTLAMKEEFTEAISIYENLLAQAKNNSDKAIALHQLGMVYRMEKKYDKAIESFSKERVLREDSLQHDLVGFSANAYEFGLIAMENVQHEQALTFFTQALKYGEVSKDLICIACAQRGLGTYLVSIDNFEGAVQNFTASIDTFSKAGDLKGAKEVLEMLNGLFD